ncbi:MAG: PleD family two-component system response regulator [Pseudomonadota bacterium]
MSARVLVVDDILANVKLLEAKLTAEYFDVVTALNGPDAIRMAEDESPDILLLDVMMPGMDGFQVCRTLKKNPKTAHIPIVMVTALDQPSDRVAGIEAGADDFLTKPVNDIALLARVRSLVRLKMMMDELRMREETQESLGLAQDAATSDEAVVGARILLVEDKRYAVKRINQALSEHAVHHEAGFDAALDAARIGQFDLGIVSLSMADFDGLRFCSQIRSIEQTRSLPLLVLVDEGDTKRLVRGLEMGVNDYLVRPIDKNELMARVRTQLKRKAYADRLRAHLQQSLEMAVTDQLTGLYNRRYMERHLQSLVSRSITQAKPLSFLIMDLDYFKSINDTYGHDVGDAVLREFANRLMQSVRGVDLACRYGGEEFVVVMPETDKAFAFMVAERLRQDVAEKPFVIDDEVGELDITVSIGVTCVESSADDALTVLRRADQALYRAKNEGRNRVVADAA